MKHLAFALLVALACAARVIEVRAQEPASDGLALLVRQLEEVVRAGQPSGYLDLVARSADERRAREFAEAELSPDATRVVVQERDRVPLSTASAPGGYRLLVEAFAEYGSHARVSTWRFDVRRLGAPGSSHEWQIADQEGLGSIENLYRLSLDSDRQYEAHNLTISAEDLDLTLETGSVFVADTDQGGTALVLLGRGDVRFRPTPDTERGQVKIFCGAETLASRFDAAFIRVNPAEIQERLALDHLTERPVDPREFRRADELFREQVSKSFGVDLGDLSSDTWSLLPAAGDFLADIRTRRFDTITYAKSSSEPEDISLFDRKRRRNIAVYASEEKLVRRGRFYNEDDLVEYDVLDYNIDVSVQPDRQWLDGRVRVRLKVNAPLVTSLTLKLANPLVVRSVVSDRFGRLLFLRARNQDSIIVNLASAVMRDAELELTISYAGRLSPQPLDRETIALGQAPGRPALPPIDPQTVLAEPSYLYSSRSFWYPQATVTDYATAAIRLVMPVGFDCVGSGDLVEGLPFIMGPVQDPVQARKVYLFTAQQPLRYFAFIVSRFVKSDSIVVDLGPYGDEHGSNGPPLIGPSYTSVHLSIQAQPQQVRLGHDVAQRVPDIARFYASLVDDYPFPSFTVAIIDNALPGGHSPGYFAVLNRPFPTSPLVWANDPAAFSNYPEFFIAHELAHQWWGQAVGLRNYHEQWLSEGFSQYFAALYAQHELGDDVFGGVLRQLRRFGMEQSTQGPIYLGYRLGHIRNNSRVYRAIVYNKSAAVLHMLRRFVGDDVFFRGVRRFYRTWRFKKAGTEDFRIAMEAEAQRPLDRFFERWIYGSTLPRLKFRYRVEPGATGQDVVLRLEQVGELFDLPVTVTLRYADKRSANVCVPVTERLVELRVALVSPLRAAEVRIDDGMLAEIVKN